MTKSRTILGLAFACFLVGTGRGQDAPPPEDPDELTVEVVEGHISDLEALQEDGDLADEDRTRLQLYRGALDSLKAARESERLASLFEEQEAQAPVELESVKAELAQPPAELKPEVPPGAVLADLEELLKAALSELETARVRLREVETETAGRETRAGEIREQVSGAQLDLEEISANESALPLPGESPALTLARRTKLRADRQALEAQAALLREERENYDARTELLPLRRERWVRRIAQLVSLEAAWQTVVDEARAADIRQKAADATRAATLAHPLVAPIAEANVELARHRDALRPELEQAQKDLAGLDPNPEVLRRQMDRLSQKVRVVGMTATVGLLLRKTRADLPDVAVRQNNIRQRRVAMANLEFDRLDLEDRREALIAGQEEEIQSYLDQLGPTINSAERAAIESEIREQLRVEREYLDSLTEDIGTYFDRLETLNDKERQIVEVTEELMQFIDQRILWIQSAKTFGMDDIKATTGALKWLFNPSEWERIAGGLGMAIRNRWPLAVGSVLFLATLLAIRRWLGSRIRAIGSSLTVPSESTLGQTMAVTACTCLRAAVLPFVLWWVGAWLHRADPDGRIDVAQAVGDAFKGAFFFAFVLMLAFETCLPRGLGEAHFGWRPANVRVARRYVGWLAVMILGFGIPVGIVNHQSTHAYESSLGRVSFIVAVAGLAFCVHGLLNPRTGVLRDFLKRHPGGWAFRLRYIWYPLAVLTPMTIAVASFIGYHFTALQICGEVLRSAAFLVVVILVYYLSLNWIYAGRRKLALEQARKRREAYEERAARGEANTGETSPPAEEMPFDISAMSAQAVQLLRGAVLFAVIIGLFAVWSDTMPAIGFLERIELWPGADEVTVVATPDEIAAGAPATETVYKMITVEDLLWGLIAVVITMIVAKNIPGLLEITILQHLPLERGSQFAMSTIIRYTITIVGIAVAFRIIGVTWAKVQWLAAALTVGLGFGLNEIFGNFISGLIILFERPIRVGDTVTVGTITGTIRQIKIRATTLMDWDRKELVIPNKTFVTDTIINWTLTDPILRLVFPVVLDHRTDTALAEELLMKAARNHPIVLTDPAPSVWFKKVGEEGLEFDLRLFIPHIDHLVRAKHEVHLAIVEAFRENGVRFFA
ncbi:MAG: mechanosensitive ion channel domain-containing protein, partial [Planctomycetota bacterium]